MKLFENDGSGGFTALADLEVGGGPRYVVAGDFNNDSYLDLAVSVRGPDDVVILENNQNGTFFRTQIIKTWPDPIPLTAGDLDNDGDIDLAFGKYKTPGEIGILENRSAVQEIGLSSPELSFGIIRSNSTTQQAIVLRNDGLSGVLEVNEIRFSTNNWTSDRSTLSLQPMQVGTMHITFAPSGPGLFEDHLALTSNDPLHPEMTVSLSGAAAPLVIAASPEPSRPAGHFVTAISATFNSAMQATTIDAQSYRVFGALSGRKEGRISYDPSLRKARFDLDDQFVFGEDVQVMLDPSLLNTPENLPLLEGHSWHFTTHTLFGTGHFMRAAADLATGQGVFGIAAGEFNHDGFPDIVVTNSDDNSITVFLNDGNQGFEADSTYVVGTNPQGVVVADVTNDGFTDILCTNSGSNSVFFLENQQNAAFRLRNLQQVGVFPRAIAAADLNNDGEIDYVTANVSANTVSIMIRRPPLLNFDRTDVPVGEAPSGLALKDLDNDGRIDIVASNRISGDIVILSREAGVFVPDTTIVVGGTPEGIVARDFDADRFVDLAVVDGSGDRIVILRNSGNARFSVVAELPTGDQPVAIYSNDFNVDGAFDLAVADFASKNVFIYHNDGSGTFNQADTTHIVDNPRSITGLDISGIAGAIDLVATQFNNDKVVILKNEIINQAPVLAAKLDDAVFPEDSGAHVLTSDLRAFFSDPDQHELLFAARSVQPGIVAQIQDSVQLVVRTELNFFGRGQIIVTATDRVATISDTIEVTVPPVNDAPVIAPIPPISFNEDDTTTVSLDTFIRDVDNDTSEIQWRFMVLLDSLNTAALPHSDEVLSPAKANRARLSDSARSTNSVNENEFFWVQNARQAVLFRQVALDSSAVLSIVIDSTSHVATFWAAPDFHADDIPVVFIATDLGGLTGVDTTTVSVLPVNDAPNAFALLSPADSSLVDSTVIVFTWHNTIDTDGDPLLYLWHLSGPDRSIYAGTVDTFFVFHGAAYLQSSETYTWFVEATDRSDTTRTAMSVFHTSVLTSVDATPEGSLPEAFVLFQNYPNPFNPSTSIKYGLPVLSKVRLSVYNLRGREVVRLIYGEQQAGYHSVVWDGRNQAGVAVASGIYIYRLVVEDASISYRRSVMMKRAVFIK